MVSLAPHVTIVSTNAPLYPRHRHRQKHKSRKSWVRNHVPEKRSHQLYAGHHSVQFLLENSILAAAYPDFHLKLCFSLHWKRNESERRRKKTNSYLSPEAASEVRTVQLIPATYPPLPWPFHGDNPKRKMWTNRVHAGDLIML